MESAAKNLTPVSLELGGKSPVVIEESRYRYGDQKMFLEVYQCGQTCIAPDWLLVHQNKENN